jgi:hypothetical protein
MPEGGDLKGNSTFRFETAGFSPELFSSPRV